MHDTRRDATRPKRYSLAASSRSGCSFAVEDVTTAADRATEVEMRRGDSRLLPLYDLVLCRYSVFLYAQP